MWRGWKDLLKDFFAGFKQTRFWQHKLAMVAIAAAMFVLVIFYTGFRAAVMTIFSYIPSTTSIDTTNIGTGGMAVENGTFSDEFQDGRVLEIKSKSSQSDRNNSDIVFMQNISGRLLRPPPDPNNPTKPAVGINAMTPSNMLTPDELMNFTTSTGVLTISKNTLLLTKAVEANLANGLNIKTTKLLMNFKNGGMTGDEAITGVGPRETFSGQGIIIENQGNDITLTGNSTMTIFARPALNNPK
ncbi:MAG: hypothetical protein QM529_03920 [Hydrotalea sp.]|nr:hypothetical protein [Hydrotalea sp.]